MPRDMGNDYDERMQAAADFHRLLKGAYRLLGRMQSLHQVLVAFRQYVIEDPEGIFDHPDDEQYITQLLLDLKTDWEDWLDSV
jgi:predicted SAM-dependent methyltransferase